MKRFLAILRPSAAPGLGVVALVGISAFAGLDAQAETEVDVELQLLLDISGSISSSEYDLQMDGYAFAFRSQDVQDAILNSNNGSFGSIAVQTVMWSSRGQQSVELDWTLLDSVGSINSYADSLANLARPYSGATYTAEGLQFGTTQFQDNGFNGARKVIDISGDGYGYDYMYGDYRWFSGENTADMRDAALASGIDTINGITITHDYWQVGDQDLTTWYANDVSGGLNAFVMEASSFEDFGTALTTKLTAEIEGGYVPVGATASAGPLNVQAAPGPGLGLVALLLGAVFARRSGRSIIKINKGSRSYSKT